MTTPDLYAGLAIGEGTVYSNENLDGVAPQLITIGRNCILAPGCFVLTHDASFLIHAAKYRFAPVVIGDDVFVGYRALVLPGVTIGDGAVIGAGAVVTRDVEAHTVVAGNPARCLGTVEELLERRDPSELVAPPYPVTYTPTAEQVLELQRLAVRTLRR